MSSFLLEDISISDIDNLILDYELKEDGYDCRYVFDSYDLRLLNSIHHKGDEFSIDRYLVYNSIILEKNSNSILPLEYWLELESTICSEEKVDKDIDIRRLLLSSDSQLDITNIKSILALIVSKNFQFDYTSNLIRDDQFDFELHDLELKSFSTINDIKILSQKIFQFVISNLHSKAIQLDTIYFQRYIYSVYIDAKVIAKYIIINKSSLKSSSKVIYLYISSTPIRSPSIFSFLSRTGKLPDVEKKTDFNFHRSGNYLYLKYLMNNFDKKNQKRIEKLFELRDMMSRNING